MASPAAGDRFELEQGDASVFNFLTVHGAPGFPFDSGHRLLAAVPGDGRPARAAALADLTAVRGTRPRAARRLRDGLPAVPCPLARLTARLPPLRRTGQANRPAAGRRGEGLPDRGSAMNPYRLVPAYIAHRRTVAMRAHAALRAGVGPSTTVPVMRGDEERVVAAYVSWLERNGWTVLREVDFADVYAERWPDKLYAEAKGRTAAIGLDVDTLYGQLLRRMKDPGSAAQYVVVVPTVALKAALRVPDWARERLHVEIVEVDDFGEVHPRY
jgi:hypothetical protein